MDEPPQPGLPEPPGGAGLPDGPPAPGVPDAAGAGADSGRIALGAAAGPGGGSRWAALRERLPLWVQLRCGLEPRTLAALAVVLVAAGLFAVQHFWSGRPQPVAAPEVVRQGEVRAPDGDRPADPPGGALPGAVTAAPSARIVVDVSGKVRKPGVLRLPAGSRVDDALEAAGGVERGADLAGLNRARVLNDGEQVVVGLPMAVAAGPGAGAAPGGGGSAPVSLNTATAEQLETLPGVGPVLAQHIIDHRTRNGGFRSVEELRDVNGIGERRFADLQSKVRP
ncbi:ComEA family DNA-binding protein [Streptomyces sp. NPDC005805]|uniref:ComEA family DNA-binding protein n=1 Tax=Streptomyces sp. NPDC005805 TaxID=3157068 RepID=UPI00340640B7